MTVANAWAPGKLFLAGEYAVVEPGRQALLVALDWGVHVQARLCPAGAQGRVFSRLYEPQGRAWELTPQGVQSSAMRAQDDVAFAVVALVDELLRERALPRQPYSLHIRSDLVSADGRKYGLGSSAAVAVACLRALSDLFSLSLAPDEVFKLGLLAGLALNPNGSGGDVAASVYGGWLHYASPDRGWLRTWRAAQTSLQALLAQAWPGLQAKRLPAPTSVQLLVGWTGAPASTTALVAGMQRAPLATGLLDASDAAVMQLAQALAADDTAQIQAALGLARKAVQAIAAARGRVIETPALQALREIAQAHGAQAKTSGAGGGDCGIALLPAGLDASAIHNAWRACQIEPLNVKVSA